MYTMIDAAIALYKWNNLMNEICVNKQCIIKNKKDIYEKLSFLKNFDYYINNVDNKYKNEMMYISNLRNNIIHPYNTFDNNNLLFPQKSIFEINSTLYTIDLSAYDQTNIDSLFEIFYSYFWIYTN